MYYSKTRPDSQGEMDIGPISRIHPVTFTGMHAGRRIDGTGRCCGRTAKDKQWNRSCSPAIDTVFLSRFFLQMKRISGGGFDVKCTTYGIMIFLWLMATAAVASDPNQAAEDWKKMDRLLTEREIFLYQSEFDKTPDAFVDNWLKFSAEFRKEAAAFTERHGSDRNTLNRLYENIQKPTGVQRENYQFVNELLGADIDGLHRTILGWAEAMGSDNYLRWEQLKDPDPNKVELKLRYAQRAVIGYRLADRLQPDADYREALDKSVAAEKETKALYTKTLESLTWPGHNKKFDGPGKPDDLAAAALEFLRENPKWSKPEYDDEHIPYAACVTGSGWDVWKRAPLTETPTQYSLDITVAFTGTKDPDIVYVYSMVFYTAEEEGIKKALPFKYANSKQYQKYHMLKKTVPNNAVYGKSVGTKQSPADTAAQPATGNTGKTADESPTKGSFFSPWRLIFGVLLILAGLIGTQTMVAARLPNMKPFLEKLVALTMPVGLLIGLLGLLGFLCNLVRLAPLASLLPQATGALLGTLFLKKKPGPVPSVYLEKIPLPLSLEPPLGVTAAILGLLHLIIGHLTLL